MTTPNAEEQLLLTRPTALAVADRPLRRAFFTGKLLDPELHPSLRDRLTRALRAR